VQNLCWVHCLHCEYGVTLSCCAFQYCSYTCNNTTTVLVISACITEHSLSHLLVIYNHAEVRFRSAQSITKQFWCFLNQTLDATSLLSPPHWCPQQNRHSSLEKIIHTCTLCYFTYPSKPTWIYCCCTVATKSLCNKIIVHLLSHNTDPFPFVLLDIFIHI
jgi:hypothetical protein